MTLRLRPAVFSVTSLGISVAGPGNNLYKDPVGREFGHIQENGKAKSKESNGEQPITRCGNCSLETKRREYTTVVNIAEDKHLIMD